MSVVQPIETTPTLLDVVKDAQGVEIAWRVECRYIQTTWIKSKDGMRRRLKDQREVQTVVEFFCDPFTPGGYFAHCRGVGIVAMLCPDFHDVGPFKASKAGYVPRAVSICCWFWDNIASTRTP